MKGKRPELGLNLAVAAVVTPLFWPLLIPVPLCILVVSLQGRHPGWQRALFRVALIVAVYPMALRVGFNLHVASQFLPSPAHRNPGVFEHLMVAAGITTTFLVLSMALVHRVPVVAAMLPMVLFLAYRFLIPSIHQALPEAATLAFPEWSSGAFFVWSILVVTLLGATARFTWRTAEGIEGR